MIKLMYVKRWTVYIPLSAELGQKMAAKGLPVFEDEHGWWGEQVGFRFWTCEQAAHNAREFNRIDQKMRLMRARIRARISGQEVPTVAPDERNAYAGIMNKSGWWG